MSNSPTEINAEDHRATELADWFLSELRHRGGKARLSEFGDALKRQDEEKFADLISVLGGKRKWVQTLEKASFIVVTGPRDDRIAALPDARDAEIAKAPPPLPQTCPLCNVKVSPGDFETHVRGRRHQRMVQETGVESRQSQNSPGEPEEAVDADQRVSPRRDSPRRDSPRRDSPPRDSPRRDSPRVIPRTEPSTAPTITRANTSLGSVETPAQPDSRPSTDTIRRRSLRLVSSSSDPDADDAQQAPRRPTPVWWYSMRFLLPFVMSIVSIALTGVIMALMLYNTSTAVEEMMAQLETQLVHGTLTFAEAHLLRILEVSNASGRYLSRSPELAHPPGPSGPMLKRYPQVNRFFMEKVSGGSVVSTNFLFHNNGRMMGIVKDWTKSPEEIRVGQDIFFYCEEEFRGGVQLYRVPGDSLDGLDADQEWILSETHSGKRLESVALVGGRLINLTSGVVVQGGPLIYNESGRQELALEATGQRLTADWQLVDASSADAGEWVLKRRYGALEHAVIRDYVGRERPNWAAVDHSIPYDWQWYGPFNVGNFVMYGVTATVMSKDGVFIGVVGTNTFIDGFSEALREMKSSAGLPQSAALFLITEKGPSGEPGLVAASDGDVMTCDVAAARRCGGSDAHPKCDAGTVFTMGDTFKTDTCRPRLLRESTSPVLAAAGAAGLAQGQFVVDGEPFRIVTREYRRHRLALIAGAVIPEKPYVERANRSTLRTLVAALSVAAFGVAAIVWLSKFFAEALEHLSRDLDRFSRLDFAPSTDRHRGEELSELATARAACLRVRRAVEAFSLYVPAGEKERLPEGLRIPESLLPQPWEQVGSGSFGRVYRSTFLRTAGDVAVKELIPQRGRETAADALARRGRFLEEMRNLERLRVNHIIMFYGWTRGPGGTLCMVTEYCAGGTLRQVATPSLSKERRGVIALEAGRAVARALLYLHSRGEVHMDVAARNVLLTSAGEYKLADLGALCMAGAPAPTASIAWSPPESVSADPSRRVARPEHDVWSFGCMLYEVFAGAAPWSHLISSELARKSGGEQMWLELAAKSLAAGDRMPPPPACGPAPGGDPLCRSLWTGVVQECWRHRRPPMGRMVELLDSAVADGPPSPMVVPLFPDEPPPLADGSDKGLTPPSPASPPPAQPPPQPQLSRGAFTMPLAAASTETTAERSSDALPQPDEGVTWRAGVSTTPFS